jgi:hypothetical protein
MKRYKEGDTFREFWIAKGTSNFCAELTMNDDLIMVKAKPEVFYDIISNSDTVEGGLHVVEATALEQAQAEIDRLNEELNNSKNFHCKHFVTHDAGYVSCNIDILKLKQQIAELQRQNKIMREALEWLDVNVEHFTVFTPNGLLSSSEVIENALNEVDKK